MHRLILTLLTALFISATTQASTSLPRYIEGMEMYQVTLYDSVDDGFSIRYKPPQGTDKLDLYIYTDGYDDLPNGISEAVRAEYVEIYAAIVRMEQLGYYAGVTEPKGGEASINFGGEDQQYLWGYTQYRQTKKVDGVEDTQSVLSSFYFLTVYQGRLIKLRYTFTETNFQFAYKRFQKVVRELEEKI